MTTIAFKDGIIAYDSRELGDFTIYNDSARKHFERNGVHFFISGPVTCIPIIMSLYFDATSEAPKGESGSAFVVDDGVVYRAGLNKKQGFWTYPSHNVNAIGSGTDHALTAMDCGLSAKEAVVMAARRDAATGGLIHTYKVKGWKGEQR